MLKMSLDRSYMSPLKKMGIVQLLMIIILILFVVFWVYFF
jgi:hypothetical protein